MLSRKLLSVAAGLSSRGFSSAAGGVNTLVLGEYSAQRGISAATLSCITAAKALGGPITLLITGKDCKQVANDAAKIADVSTVLVADSPAYANPVAEGLASLLNACQTKGSYSHIVGSTSALSKSALPRLGGQLDVQPISDVISVKSADTFVRPIYAGNALSTVRSSDKLKLLTVRPTAFDQAPRTGGSAKVEDAPAAAPPAANDSKFVSSQVKTSDKPELQSARVVVSGGRGVGSAQNFGIIEALAAKLNGAVGASRAAVDAGYAPNELQVGQTGKVVAPDLYVAVGISGAIQHLAGMKDSKVIVAINKNAEAPIFQVADYGLVADLFTAVPEMTQKL
eukprot:gnl/Hemi2/21078_TR6997_c0_g15_i1.p1 gnl/Hemi2/21078_TR6997_c0_g15~~gnl/Hemi2/21078_TR6997_c0_g15_i1.p1  ORF type:complete len:339 (-),score=90.92 gnl/Hemi2/21078_TR6997_c0_g15_i1:84-1100(-)